MRGGERGNQRTFSSAFGEFQTTRPPTVDNAGHPTKRVEHDTTQQTEMCRKYIACAENILNAMFKLGKIMLSENFLILNNPFCKEQNITYIQK